VSDDDLEGAGVLPARLSIVTLCTGNAARSVMAGSMLEVRAEAEGLALKSSPPAHTASTASP